jgi:hypothetical protein
MKKLIATVALVASLSTGLGVVTAPPASAAQDFSQARAADIGVNEKGTSRPTGYDQQGECIKSVQRWITAAGGRMAGGGAYSAYINSPADLVATGTDAVAARAVKGDVIQYTYNPNRDEYAAGVHTVMVVANNGNGTLRIVQSNAAFDGRVTVVDGWRPTPPANFTAYLWRFGQVGSGGSSSSSNDQQYAGRIVQWNGDTKAQRTSWVVSAERKRYWIPDGGTYICLRGTGFGDSGAVSSSVLDRLPDQYGQAISCGSDRLSTNRVMLRNTYIRSSDGRYMLWLQNDGNLVMYGPQGAIWANHRTSDFFVLQSDGNLVAYAFGKGATWWSGTSGTGANTLTIQNDGNLVLYSPSRAVWTYNRGRI